MEEVGDAMDISRQQSPEPLAEPVAEETEQNPSMTTRNINLAGVYPIESDDKGGTPNRCIARLIEQCIELHKDFEEIEQGNIYIVSEILFPTRKKGSKKSGTNIISTETITIESARELAEEVKNAKRDSLTKEQTHMITTIIVKAVKKIKEITKKNTRQSKEIYISRLWYSILIKSVSDVAQFGSVIRNAHLIPKETIIPPCIAYLSSDLIAAAEATTLGREVKHPYLILSTRKTANITQQIILQKREIAVTSIFLICMFDENSQYLQNIVGNYTSPDPNNEASVDQANLDGAIINGVYKQMNETGGLVDDFKSDFRILMRSSPFSRGSSEDTIMQKLQGWADRVVNGVSLSYDKDGNLKHNTNEGQFKEEVYVNFIDKINQYEYLHTDEKIYTFTEIIERFEKMIKHGSEDNMFTIPRWIHQMSVDIYSAYEPVKSLNDKEITSISNAEIIAATEDATYGHDFKAIEGITYLGEVFMNEVLVHVQPGYTPFNYHRNKANMPVVSFEKKCIVDVLHRNKYVTITQNRDQYVVIFNPTKNFLTYDLNKMPLQDTVTRWNIGLTPLYHNIVMKTKTSTGISTPTLTNTFIPRDIYMSIDFSKGTPSFYEHISYTKNAIRNYSRIEPNTYAFDFILDRDYDQLIDKINSGTGFKEIVDVTTMFDGAAPIGGVPFVFRNSDRTLVQHINMINVSVSVDQIITMTTERDNSADIEIIEDWIRKQVGKGEIGNNIQNISSAIKSRMSSSSQGIINENDSSIMKNRELEYMYEFGLIIGMFFNAVYNKNDVIEECKSIANSLKGKVEMATTNQRESRKRKAVVKFGNEDDGSEILTTIKNTTIETIVSKLIENNTQGGNNEKVKKVYADDIIDDITNSLISENINLLPVVIAGVFDRVLTYEIKETQKVQPSSEEEQVGGQGKEEAEQELKELEEESGKKEEEKDQEKEGEEDEEKERVYLDCMFILLSGALNISSRNMTNGNFLSGETLLNNGVIDEKIIQEIENTRYTTKLKERVLRQTFVPAVSVGVAQGFTGSMRDADATPDKTITNERGWMSEQRRTSGLDKFIRETGSEEQQGQAQAQALLNQATSKQRPASKLDKDLPRDERTFSIGRAASAEDLPAQAAVDTHAAYKTEGEEEEGEEEGEEGEEGQPSNKKSRTTATPPRPKKRPKEGGNNSRKRIKALKDAIRRRSIKLHSKVNSSSKGSRKVHKERKPQRTRRLNK